MSLFLGETVYDDHNIHEIVGDGQAVHAGGELRYLTCQPRPTAYGSAGIPTFDSAFGGAFSESEIIQRALELDAKQERISDMITWPSKDQDGTPLCWSFGCTGAMEVQIVKQGLPYTSLSPASGAGPITGYSLRGGYGEEFQKQAMQVGIARSSLQPDYKIAKSYRTAEVEADCANHKLIESYDLPSNNLLALWTMLVLKKPCPLGLDWWGHLIFACDVVVERGIIVGTRIRNSWSDSWGAKNKHGVGGFGTLAPSKSKGDAFAVAQMTSYAHAL